MTHRTENLLQQMTLQEKASLTTGGDMWGVAGIPRIGLPPLKVTDGPNGARGGTMDGSISSACFPCGSALAATWDLDLIARVGAELAREAQSKGASVLLAPTINIHRTPLLGRHFECHSEDPFLSGKTAAAYIRGLQAQGVGACPKHYVCNDSEFQRMVLDIEVDERTLREIYLLPFEMAVKEGGTWAMMTAYNQVNGEFAASSTRLLRKILKEEWGFDGLVMSDWFGTKSTVGCFLGGLDLEMPGPGFMMGQALVPRIEAGELPEALLDDKVRRYLRLMERTGALDQPGPTENESRDDPATGALIREAAAASFVLLKNEAQALPLAPDQLDSLAVIGPNARLGAIMGGGSAMVNAPYQSQPLEAIQDAVGDRVELQYRPGCTNHKFAPDLEPTHTGGAEDGLGIKVEYFDHPAMEGEPVATEMRDSTQFYWIGRLPAGVPPGFSARISFRFTPDTTGDYEFGLASLGLTRLRLDGEEVINLWEQFEPGDTFIGMGSVEKRHSRPFRAGSETHVTVEFSCMPGAPLGVLRLGVIPPLPEDAIEQAAQAAAESDAALVVVGLNQAWEGEGHDRAHMDLVGRQDELVSAVAARNPRTIVVVNAGAPVHMPWADEVAAILYAWYPGQEFGRALSDVLFGQVNPAGRLPVTLPRHLHDTPGYVNYPGEHGRVRYGEGLFVGYRHYDARRMDPLFAFGHGLSYTSFAYSNLTLSGQRDGDDESIQVTVEVSNTGACAGDEVVQLYVVPSQEGPIMRPARELKGFQRIHLAVGETRRVEFALTGRDLSYYDTRAGGWRAPAGLYGIALGASSRDIRLERTYRLEADWNDPPLDPTPQLSVDAPLALVMMRGGQSIQQALGPMGQLPQVMMIWNHALENGLSLRELARFLPDLMTPAKLDELGALLEELNAQA